MNYGLEDVEVVEGVRMPFAHFAEQGRGVRGLGILGVPADDVVEQERREALGSRRSLEAYLYYRREINDERRRKLFERIGISIGLCAVGAGIAWFGDGMIQYVGIPVDLGGAFVALHAAVKY